MLFWVITGLIVLGVLALFAQAIRRGQNNSEDPVAYDLRVYRDQLKEVERDVARGVLSEEDADRVRTEISRRILAADANLGTSRQTASVSNTGYLAMGGIGALVILGAFGLYTALGAPGYGDLALADRIAMAEQIRTERPNQATAEANVGENIAPASDSAEYAQLVEQLRTALAERQDDVRGFRLLAQAESRLGNMIAAHQAQGRVVELTGGPDADVKDLADFADMLILAAGGYVSPEAERVLSAILNQDVQNPVALYYWGLMYSQTGRPDTAFRLWDGLLRRGPPDAPWIPAITAQIEDMAALAGVRYQLPQAGSGRGPTADDIDAAGDMSPAERMDMIEGMVSGLSERLGSEGGPPEDWAQLITALGVLGRMDQAAAIFSEAQSAWGENPGAMDVINRAADRAGLL